MRPVLLASCSSGIVHSQTTSRSMKLNEFNHVSFRLFYSILPFKPEKTASFLSFPYVCPEPVLAKCSFIYINGSKMPFSRTIDQLPLGACRALPHPPQLPPHHGTLHWLICGTRHQHRFHQLPLLCGCGGEASRRVDELWRVPCELALHAGVPINTCASQHIENARSSYGKRFW